MNDLVEKALHGLDRGRRQLTGRPALTLSLAGFAVGSFVVVAGGRASASRPAVPIDRWLGLLPRAGARNTTALPGALLLGGIVVLLALWLLAMRVAHVGRLSEGRLWGMAAAWALPFAAGPPLLSTDVFADVAHGLLQRHDLDPYRHTPSALGSLRVVEAIDPARRGARSGAGPLGTAIEHLAVTLTGGNALAAVAVLRVLAILSAVAVGVLATELAGPRRTRALTITVLNPALLLYVVSGAELDGVVSALLLGALVAASRRRWPRAILLSAVACAVLPFAVVALFAVVVFHAAGRQARDLVRTVAVDVAIAAGAFAVCALVVPDGLGWTRTLTSVTLEHTPFAPASVVGDVVARIVPAASFDDLAAGGRIAAGLAALTAVGYLLVTARQRPLERTSGYALLAVGALGPVLYPWFLLPGLVCLAPTAVRARRDWVIALSCAACVLVPIGFGHRAGDVVTAAALLVIAVVLVPRLVRRERLVSAGAPPAARRGRGRW